jgi:hypothetical protein
MEKTVTKEEVERVIKANADAFAYKEAPKKILNELFPSFKVGDWVVGWHSCFKELTHNAWKIDDFDRHGRVVPVGKKGYATSIESLRHATPEEIAAAEWEEGKPYKVWSDDGRTDYVRISSDTIGKFYAGGHFSGGCFTYDKYEKL